MLSPIIEAIIARNVPEEDHIPILIPSTVIAELTMPKDTPFLKDFDSTSFSIIDGIAVYNRSL